MKRRWLLIAALACIGATAQERAEWRWLGFEPGLASVYFDAAGSDMNTVDSAIMIVAVARKGGMTRTAYDLDCATMFGTDRGSRGEPVNLGLLTPYGSASWALCHRLPLTVGQRVDDPLADAQTRPLSELRRLDAELLASPTATAVLEKRCGDLRLAETPRIRADVDRYRVAASANSRVRKALGVEKREMLGFRRVKLMCGSHMLSQAENWFVPSRLTLEMNQALDTTDISFGTAIRPLSPSRTTQSHRLNLWHKRFPPWPDVLTHRAIVRDGQGRPIAYVIENYQRVLVTGAD